MEEFRERDNLAHAELFWSNVLEIIKTRLPESTFNTWLAKTKGLSLTDEKIIVEAPNSFWIEWIELNYKKVIDEVLKNLGKNINVVFTPKSETDDGTLEVTNTNPRKERVLVRMPLNPRFTFDSFVVGKCNEIAYNAAYLAATNPGKEYNPLFIHGGVGLGKTHLLTAIGNHIYSNSGKYKAAVIRCEDLLNELIESIQKRRTKEFRERYRNVDILLIDDIQFLEDKTVLQEELFHTFNYLFERQKQIVMTSDRSPLHINALEERLVSRFQWGLVVEISKPDFETRLAITKKKVEEEKIILPEEVIVYIAETVRDNVRTIEGSIKILKAYMSLSRKIVTLEVAKDLLANIIKPTSNVSMQELIKVVAQEFKLSPHDLKSKSRKKEVVLARQISMYFARNMIGMSLSTIGSFFGGKDHTTVLHSIQKVEKLKGEPKIEILLNEISRKLKLI